MFFCLTATFNETFGMFSDAAKEKNPTLKQDGYLNETPVYIVTFKGITKKGHDTIGGKEPTIFKEHNVVVDAMSGEVLFSFDYR